MDELYEDDPIPEVRRAVLDQMNPGGIKDENEQDPRFDELRKSLAKSRDEAANARAASGFHQRREELRRQFEGADDSPTEVDIMAETRRMLG